MGEYYSSRWESDPHMVMVTLEAQQFHNECITHKKPKYIDVRTRIYLKRTKEQESIKAVISKVWFECNQRIFKDKFKSWNEQYELSKFQDSYWCSLSKIFGNYYIFYICYNWDPLISAI